MTAFCRIKRERGENPRQDRCCVGERYAKAIGASREGAYCGEPEPEDLPADEISVSSASRKICPALLHLCAVCRCAKCAIAIDGICGPSADISRFSCRKQRLVPGVPGSPASRRDKGEVPFPARPSFSPFAMAASRRAPHSEYEPRDERTSFISQFFLFRHTL